MKFSTQFNEKFLHWKTNHLRIWHENSHSPPSVDNHVDKSLDTGKMVRMTYLFIESPIF